MKTKCTFIYEGKKKNGVTKIFLKQVSYTKLSYYKNKMNEEMQAGALPCLSGLSPPGSARMLSSYG